MSESDLTIKTLIAPSFYRGGLNRLVEGSAADQLTDCLHDVSFALNRSGMGTKLGKMARCTVVGHMNMKSYLGENAAPLLGVQRFFEVWMQNGPPTVRHRLHDETQSLQKTSPPGRPFSVAQRSLGTANTQSRQVILGGLGND